MEEQNFYNGIGLFPFFLLLSSQQRETGQLVVSAAGSGGVFFSLTPPHFTLKRSSNQCRQEASERTKSSSERPRLPQHVGGARGAATLLRRGLSVLRVSFIYLFIFLPLGCGTRFDLREG